MSYDPRAMAPPALETLPGDVQAALAFAQTLPVKTDIPNVFLGAQGQVWDVRQNTEPTRQRARRVAADTESFVALVNDLQESTSRVFSDPVRFSFLAILDFGTAAHPTRDEHSVHYVPRKNPEWEAWANLHAKPVDQITFADFIEEHLDSVIEPDGADLLDIVQTIKGHRGIQFKSAHRLANGETKLAFDETLTTTGGSGEVTIPNTLTIRTPVFRGEDPITFVAYLRHRIGDNGSITFTIKIQKADDVVPDAFELIVEKVDSGVAPIAMYSGWPE